MPPHQPSSPSFRTLNIHKRYHRTLQVRNTTHLSSSPFTLHHKPLYFFPPNPKLKCTILPNTYLLTNRLTFSLLVPVKRLTRNKQLLWVPPSLWFPFSNISENLPNLLSRGRRQELRRVLREDLLPERASWRTSSGSPGPHTGLNSCVSDIRVGLVASASPQTWYDGWLCWATENFNHIIILAITAALWALQWWKHCDTQHRAVFFLKPSFIHSGLSSTTGPLWIMKPKLWYHLGSSFLTFWACFPHR